VSFEIAYYYLIEPTPPLVERVRAALDANFASVILERVVISKRHVAGHLAEADEAHLIALKLALLSLLKIDRIWDTPAQFEQVFGSTELSAELFDRWWTLTEIEYVSFEEWERFVGPAVPFIRPQTNPRVADWLAERAKQVRAESAGESRHPLAPERKR
jgi:hypothetical protein